MKAVVAAFVMLMTCAASAAEQPYRIADYGGLFTDVMIDGQGPFSFLIDTGASNSLMFEHVRQTLKLAQSQPRPLMVYGVNDVTSAVPVKPAALRIGSEQVRNLTMGVLPDRAAGQGDGVLGLDILERYFVVLDRATMRLKLLTPGSAATSPYRDWTAVPITPRALKSMPIHFWYLSVRFNERRFTSLFDLGGGTTLLNWDAGNELGVRKKDFSRYGPPPEDLQDILGNTAPALRVMNIEMALPGMIWSWQTAIVADAPAFGYFDLNQVPAAIVGPGLLHNTSLAIDFSAGRLYLGPSVEAR